MIVDGRQIPRDLVVHSDVCIVGTGMGGCSLLQELLPLPISITVVEAGDKKSGSTTVPAEMIGRDFALPNTRAIQLGGTVHLWHGVCAPLDPIDFEARPWIAHSGWPIDLDQLAPYYARACSLLGVPAIEYFDGLQLPESLRVRLADIPINDILKNKIFQVVGSPRRLIQSTVPELERLRHVQCFINSVALELRTNEADSRVQELIVNASSKRTISVRARYYVLCAGGLETPRLLLNSNAKNSNGVGNEHDVVGRYLADHPIGNLCQIEFHSPRRAPLYSDMRLGDSIIRSGLVFHGEVQRHHQLPNHNFYLRPSFKRSLEDDTQRVKKACQELAAGRPTVANAWLLMRNPGVVLRLLRYKRLLIAKYRYADVFFQTEQVPNPQSRVQLSEQRDQFGYRLAQVNWALCQQDHESMATSFQLVRRALHNRTHAVVHGLEDIQWDSHMTSAAHHLGTARMGRLRTTAVVNENLQVFAKENLFICDASVFPTAGNANPSLTICALATRLADHLRRKLPQDTVGINAVVTQGL